MTDGETLNKIDDAQVETCELRRLPRVHTYIQNLNIWFIMPQSDPDNNGIIDTPTFDLESVTIQNAFFEWQSIIMIQGPGYMTVNNCLLTRLSPNAAFIQNIFYSHFDNNYGDSYTAYLNNANSRPAEIFQSGD